MPISTPDGRWPVGREQGGRVLRPKAPVQAYVTANEAIRALERLLDRDELTRRNLRQLVALGQTAETHRLRATQPAGA
jgi:cytidylate kinase